MRLYFLHLGNQSYDDDKITENIINMDETDSANFRRFVEVNWGQRLNDRGEIIRGQEVTT